MSETKEKVGAGAKPASHELKPGNQGTLGLLRSAVSAPGWATTPALMYLGGQLLVDVLPELPDPPAKDEGLKAWSGKAVGPISLTEKQREALKSCIRFHVEKGQLAPGPESMRLLVELGLAGGDE